MFDEELEEMRSIRKEARRCVDVFICRIIPFLMLVLLVLLFIFQYWEGRERKKLMSQDLAERQEVMRQLYRKGAGTTICEKKDGRWTCVDETGAKFVINIKRQYDG